VNSALHLDKQIAFMTISMATFGLGYFPKLTIKPIVSYLITAIIYLHSVKQLIQSVQHHLVWQELKMKSLKWLKPKDSLNNG
jgi:hypothetical protein